MSETGIDKKLAKSLMDIHAILYVRTSHLHGLPAGIHRFIATTDVYFHIRNSVPRWQAGLQKRLWNFILKQKSWQV